ncbi:MAG: hypothetical protein ACM3WP_05180 [Acidobacteriota bacterium]
MKNALFELLVPRYFWTLWNVESAQKLASSVINSLFCEPGSGEVAQFMAEQQALIGSKTRELAREESLCRALTCAVYNFSYGRYVDAGGKVGILFPPFIGFVRAIHEVASDRERAGFLDVSIAKVGSQAAEPLLKLLWSGLYRPLPHTPDSKLMRDEVATFIQRTSNERVTSLDALEIVEVSGRVAAAIVAFSGKWQGNGTFGARIRFENSTDMLCGGFEPRFGMLQTANPDASELCQDELFPGAFRMAIALVCHFVRTVLQDKTQGLTIQYLGDLQWSVAKLCAERFGFNQRPAQVLETIRQHALPFDEKIWINTESAGENDCFGKILDDLSTAGNSNRFGFLVGSEKQPIGCAALFMGALIRLQDVFSKVQQQESVAVR